MKLKPFKRPSEHSELYPPNILFNLKKLLQARNKGTPLKGFRGFASVPCPPSVNLKNINLKMDSRQLEFDCRKICEKRLYFV